MEKYFKLVFITKDKPQRQKLYQELDSIIDHENLQRVTMSNEQFDIIFKNGSRIKAIGSNDASSIRGMKYTAFVDLCGDLSKEQKDCLIANTNAPQFKL